MRMMRKLFSGMVYALVTGSALTLTLTAAPVTNAQSPAIPQTANRVVSQAQGPMSAKAQTALVQQYCVGCHDEAQKPGGLSLESFDGTAHLAANIAAMMVQKLKAGQMPPAGMPRPDESTTQAFITTLETAAIPGMAAAAAAAAAAPVAQQVITFPHTGDQMTLATQNAVVHQICTQCHNDKQKAGGVSMIAFDAATAPAHAELVEAMIAKVRAGMMPKMGAAKKPDAASARAFAASLERRIDCAAAAGSGSGAPALPAAEPRR